MHRFNDLDDKMMSECSQVILTEKMEIIGLSPSY
jgi:hypothetical protein